MNKGFLFSWIVIFPLEISLDYIFKFTLIIIEKKEKIFATDFCEQKS